MKKYKRIEREMKGNGGNSIDPQITGSTITKIFLLPHPKIFNDPIFFINELLNPRGFYELF
jgi:hypothetical protein